MSCKCSIFGSDARVRSARVYDSQAHATMMAFVSYTTVIFFFLYFTLLSPTLSVIMAIVLLCER